ncbi:MAG: hypothetical protein JRK53_12700 [Deltaproteobacteria bacterium]|nr:hypothetical protein [Deltaproteobacteria bacterium]MBW1819541.1 hypothetical protein [Deltaproteobacteria bacterium]
MILDIFSRRKSVRTGKPKDEFDRIIEVIEKFAPGKHQGKREMHYYNYRIMAPYANPLLDLLKLLSRKSRLTEDADGFAWDVFSRLKTFYDPRDRLSPEEAKEDGELIRKYEELYRYFYGREAVWLDFSRRPPEGRAE